MHKAGPMIIIEDDTVDQNILNEIFGNLDYKSPLTFLKINLFYIIQLISRRHLTTVMSPIK